MAALINTPHEYVTSEGPVALEPVEMRDLMMDALANLEELIRKRGAQVTYTALPRVLGTPQLGQLLQNLIENAIKYCEAEIPLVHVSPSPLVGNFCQFSVQDKRHSYSRRELPRDL